MKRYHRVIEALQWFPEIDHELVKKVEEDATVANWGGGIQHVKKGDYVLMAQRKYVIISGDWIIKQSDGNWWVLPDNEFKSTFREINDSQIICTAYQIANQDLEGTDYVQCAEMINMKPEDYNGLRDFPKVVAVMAKGYIEAMKGL